jgi:hypothetical protein
MGWQRGMQPGAKPGGLRRGRRLWRQDEPAGGLPDGARLRVLAPLESRLDAAFFEACRDSVGVPQAEALIFIIGVGCTVRKWGGLNCVQGAT